MNRLDRIEWYVNDMISHGIQAEDLQNLVAVARAVSHPMVLYALASWAETSSKHKDIEALEAPAAALDPLLKEENV